MESRHEYEYEYEHEYEYENERRSERRSDEHEKLGAGGPPPAPGLTPTDETSLQWASDNNGVDRLRNPRADQPQLPSRASRLPN
jgi:hypothetical protein